MRRRRSARVARRGIGIWRRYQDLAWHASSIPLQPAREQPTALARRSEERLCAAAPGDRLGPAADRGRDSVARIDGLESAAASRLLARPPPERVGGHATNVPCPVRSAAHGHQAATRASGPRSRRARPQRRRETRPAGGHELRPRDIDDYTRLAYSELHPDELGQTCVSFTQRALAWYARHGITPERVMTRQRLELPLRRLAKEPAPPTPSSTSTITPHRPQTNGKIERLSKRWPANGATASPTAQAPTEPRPLWLDH